MPASTALPLFLLMLTWILPARVHSQTVDVRLVSTQHVEVTWERVHLWYGVEKFQVGVSSQDTSDCLQSVNCSTPTCSFDSLACGLYQPCTPTTITVSGGNHTAPVLALVTGPESVTNMNMRLEEGVQYISWANPSNDSSPCYKQTAVRISFNNKNSTDYFGHGNESTSKALCVSGEGMVEVWAEGGDGHSGSSSGTIVYTDSDVVDLVTFGTCETAGCTSIAVKWSYVPVCPDVAYFSITLTDNSRDLQDRSTRYFSFNVTINATSMTATGLGYDRYYYTCIVAKDKDGEELADDCFNRCKTDFVVPQNLTVKPISDSTLRATWEPPVCQPETPPLEYRLWAYHNNKGAYSTADTTYDIEGLSSFRLYEVTLQAAGYGRFNNASNTLIAEEYTKLGAPSLYLPSVHKSYVEVSWYHYVSNYYDYDIYYMVTWGKNLQFYEETKQKYFVIKDFDNIDEVVQVCVAAALTGREDLTSQTECYPATYSGMEGWVIALIATGVCLLVVVISLLVVFKIKRSKTQSRLRQELNRQQQEHQRQKDEPPPYMYAAYNTGTNL